LVECNVHEHKRIEGWESHLQKEERGSIVGDFLVPPSFVLVIEVPSTMMSKVLNFKFLFWRLKPAIASQLN
jgi:hypothetical protein